MKKFLKTLALTAGIASASTASATTVLYWNDYNVGTDYMAAALSALPGSFSVTTATGDSDFTTQLGAGGWDLAILAVQNSSGYSSIGALGAYVTGGGRAIYQSWNSWDSAQIAPFGGAFTGVNNQTSVAVSDAGLAAGLSSNPLALTNPGWGTFSTGLSGTVVAATFGNGDAAILIGNSGRTILNGFLTDTITDGTDAVRLYTNEIYAVTGAGGSVPDATSSLSLVAFGAGLMLLVRRRRA